MSAYRKNLMVGLTVIAALLLLGWMILKFGNAPFEFFATPQMPVTFVAPSAEGLSEGSLILYKGVNVGRVVKITRSPDQRDVLIHATVDQNPPLPSNVKGRIRSQILGGGSSINLILVQSRSSTTAPASRNGEVSPSAVALTAGATIPADFVGFDIWPSEIGELAQDMILTSKEIRLASQEFRQAELMPKAAELMQDMQVAVSRATTAIEHIDSVVTDTDMRKNIGVSLENFRQASESAVRIGQDLESLASKADKRFDELADNTNDTVLLARRRVDELTRDVGGRLDQLASILGELEKAGKKLNEGKGTAAQLLSNPELYDNLLDTSKELNTTLKSLRRLVEQWEEEGVPVKL